MIDASRKKNAQHDKQSIDVIHPTNCQEENLHSFTSSYVRHGNNLYSYETKIEVDKDGGKNDAWDIFDKHLIQCEPLKIVKWERMMMIEDNNETDRQRSYLDGYGVLIDSYQSLVDSMPNDALDAIVTVQAKPRGMSPCKLCKANKRDHSNMMDDNEETKKQPTNEDIMRHNLHIADSKLTVVPYDVGDEQNLFLGQGHQITTSKRLRDVLIDRTEDNGLKTCVAQVNIFSKEESNTSAMVDKCGRIIIERAAENDGKDTGDTSPLASLLPWLRVPSFLLHNEDDDGKIDIQEINFWMCPEESVTNTHYDGHHNILMVLAGTKTVELSPPGTIRGSPVHGQHANHPYLLQCTNVGGNLLHEHNNSDHNARQNNIVVSVTKGSALFIPEGWWHRVESSANCIAINIWFNHKSSISSIVHDNNQHQLPYQARDMIRRYIDANMDELNRSRQSDVFSNLLEQVGGYPYRGIYGWRREPGQPIKDLIDKMNFSSPRKLSDEQIINSMAIIQRFGTQLLEVSTAEGSDIVQPLRQIALPHAIKYFGIMISLFITRLDPMEQRDRLALLSLFQRFPPVTEPQQRQIFTSIVKSIAQGACYVLSVAWEKHECATDVEASYTALFGRCISDEGRKHFTKEVDAFRNESAKKLILGDLMLLNPSLDGHKI